MKEKNRCWIFEIHDSILFSVPKAIFPKAFIPSKKSVYLYIPQPGYPIKKDNRAVLLKGKQAQKQTIWYVVI
jgi:hypothetical protein